LPVTGQLNDNNGLRPKKKILKFLGQATSRCSVMSKYIAVVCDFYSTANGYGGTNERRKEKEVSRGLYKVWVYFSRN
jgi:hypothetical protein